MVSIAVSFLIMIVSVSVSSGFRNEIRDGISDLTGDVQLMPVDMNYISEASPISIKQSFIPDIEAIPEVKDITPAVYRAGIVKKGESIHGVLFKGTPREKSESDTVRLGVSIPIRLSDMLGLKVGANLQAKHIRQPDRNRDTESHCVGFRFLTRSSFEQNAVDAFAFLDDSSAIDSRSDILYFRNRFYVRYKTLFDRNRGCLADVVHIHRHQLHIARKIGNTVPDLVPEAGRDGDGNNHNEERDSDGDHRYPSSETEASGYEP